MNLVFSGLKNFSFLHTPPSNRISIKSFLKLQTSQLLKEALTREKIRNGQCFIVQNDITKMNSIKKEINKLLPDFKVDFVHGKLPKNEIKKVMSNFKNGQIDGLICTTIIEMGLDIQNANTMIILNSHNFGLSQLHQLRGRVGRSEKQGYCYFLIPTLDIPKLSRNRLDTVIKHSNLGEGFMIAQEDLEIRGGGEMLGERQSGHVDNIGLSLYLSMLKDSIQYQQNNKPINKNDFEINFYDSVYISEKYLPSPTERLKVYKKINSVNSIDELNNIKKNIEDRCGKIPKETMNLIRNKKISLRIANSGIKSIKSNEKNTNFYLSNNINDKVFKKFISLASQEPDKYSINKENKFVYKCNELKSNERRKNVNLLLDEVI
jgi:transcription-repair coupling factor (superfamily II helicase)